MALVQFIVGGARSGKSTFALTYAEKHYSSRVFIATAAAIDEEMVQRIETHKKEREGKYVTIEEQICIDRVLSTLDQKFEVAVIDCLTVWLGNIFYHCSDDTVRIKEYVDTLISNIPYVSCDTIFISNEVGCGIVPDNPLARSYRDLCGYMNRRIAELASTVYLCSCGITLKIKDESQQQQLL